MRDSEDVFLFLSDDEEIASGLTVIGFSQGKFSIVGDVREARPSLAI
jgi:hypothetical protein